METRFINQCTRNRKLAKELFGYLHFGRKMSIACFVVMATCFACSILLVSLGEIYSRAVLIGVPLYFAYKIFYYYSQVNTMLKRDREIHNEEISVEMRFLDEEILMETSNGSVTKLGYSSIHRVKQTKNLILLFTKAKMVCVVHKQGFTQGTTEEFLLFLRDKGIKA